MTCPTDLTEKGTMHRKEIATNIISFNPTGENVVYEAFVQKLI